MLKKYIVSFSPHPVFSRHRVNTGQLNSLRTNTCPGMRLDALDLAFDQGGSQEQPSYAGLATLELNLYRALGLSRVPKQVGLQATLLEAQEAADSTSPLKEESL